MAIPGEIYDIAQLFERTFGGRPYVVGKDGQLRNDTGVDYRINTPQRADMYGRMLTPKGSKLQEKYKGVLIWLPTTLYAGGVPVSYLPYSVIKLTGKKTLVRTPLPERTGTVKEQYNIDDYEIVLKGFVIGDVHTSYNVARFPEDELDNLKNLYEAKTALTIDNALTNIFLTNKDLNFFEQRRVVIASLDLPEVSGGKKNVRPFVMKLESDSVFTLELKN